MANPFLDAAGKEGGSPSSSNPFLQNLGKTTSPSSANPFIQVLDGGATTKPTDEGLHIWETAKGAGRGLIDLLSRPNYAAAGAAEELFTERGGGPVAALKRVGSELLSGIGPIQGQKEGFGQVMEQSGVGELGKLSDVLPFLYNDTGEGAALQRGGWADPTGRGALGLTADVFLDPTTYVTVGGAATRRFLSKQGVRYLSKEGQAALREIEKTLEPAYRLVNEEADDVLRVKARRQVIEERGRLMDEAIAANPKLIDKTGIKWFGNEVISDRTLAGLSDSAKKVVLSVPGGDWAARQADSLGRMVQRTFDPYADLSGLPPDVREGMKAVIRENRSAAAMHKANLASKWEEVADGYYREARKYGKGDGGAQALGKKFADWREGTGAHDLTKAEREVFEGIARMYDEGQALGLREGLITEEQAAKYGGKYLHHEYKNPEVLSETVKHAGRPVDRIITTEQFQRERAFDTLAEAVAESKKLRDEGLRARAAGEKRPVYGELIPEYDAMKNLGSWIQQTTDSVWRKQTYQEARDKFGLALDELVDPSRTYALDATRQIPKQDRIIVEDFLGRHKTIAGLAEAFDDADPIKGWEKAADEARTLLPKLSTDGKRELARELVSRARSHGQIIRVREALGDHLMPSFRAVKAGDVEPYFLKYGQPGEIVTVTDGLWGKGEYSLPAAVVKMVEEAPRDFIMDAARKRDLQGFVKAWDWYNNAFKAITYPFYPSGAFRDTYNNVMQAFLGIGVGAFARPFQAGRVLRGKADDILRFGEHEMPAATWNKLAADIGVTDRSAASFAQFTGEEGVKRASLLTKARVKRGSVDNITRVQLWINNIAAGMTPEDAAQVVKDFLFDYGELSDFDKYAMRRAMPFYVFPRKAIESYGRAAIKTPGRVANMAKPFRGREDENNSLTTWEGEGFKLRLDRDGKNLTMLNGVDLPVRTLDMLWRGSPVKTMNGWLSMASPAIKVPYEIVSGQDPFRGQPMGRARAYTAGPILDRLPRVIQDWAGYRKEYDAAGRPKYTVRDDRVQVLAEAALFSRILSTSDRAFREQARDPNVAARLLDFMTGLRFKSLNLDAEEARKAADRERILQDEAVKQGTIREGSYYYRSKGAAR